MRLLESVYNLHFSISLWFQKLFTISYNLIFFCVLKSTKETLMAQKPWQFLPLCPVQGEQRHHGCYKCSFKVPQVWRAHIILKYRDYQQNLINPGNVILFLLTDLWLWLIITMLLDLDPTCFPTWEPKTREQSLCRRLQCTSKCVLLRRFSTIWFCRLNVI